MVVLYCITLLLFSWINSAEANCLVAGGCGGGSCCSAFGVCGSGVQYCGTTSVLYPGWSGSPYVGSDCRLVGCGAGYCCSPYGYCGASTDYCGGTAVFVVPAPAPAPAPAIGQCRLTGCPAGSCCSQYGYCGNSAAHCGVVTYGNCGATSCGAGLCCTRYGYCGTAGAYCALQKSASSQPAASLEGEFKGKATYYNETQAGTQYSTCGIERGHSLDEGNIPVYAAALNKDQFDPYTVDGIPSNNPICQKKALVKGTRGEIIVRFIDRCPDCKTGDLGLTQEGFMAVAGEIGNGVTDVEWHFI